MSLLANWYTMGYCAQGQPDSLFGNLYLIVGILIEHLLRKQRNLAAPQKNARTALALGLSEKLAFSLALH